MVVKHVYIWRRRHRVLLPHCCYALWLPGTERIGELVVRHAFGLSGSSNVIRWIWSWIPLKPLLADVYGVVLFITVNETEVDFSLPIVLFASGWSYHPNLLIVRISHLLFRGVHYGDLRWCEQHYLPSLVYRPVQGPDDVCGRSVPDVLRYGWWLRQRRGLWNCHAENRQKGTQHWV